MKIPITKHGLPQVLIFPAATIVIMSVLFILMPLGTTLFVLQGFLLLILIWLLMFFRDPKREIKKDEKILLSPADGVVSDISETEIPEIQGKSLRIGIFLSIFNVHVNRIPCSVNIKKITYKKGFFKNAMAKDAGKVNESNDILMTRLFQPHDNILVRQISGAIARHIVCAAKEETQYDQGEIFGMIKFGSRAEIYIPLKENKFDIAVKIGDKVNAGLTPLIQYK